MSGSVKRPRWYRLTPFLGKPPELTARQWRVLGLVAVVSLFEQYDLYLFSLSLKQIQADLAIGEGDLGMLGSVVRMGAVLALPIALAADRMGRRKLLLVTVLGYTLLTGATAFAPTAEAFVALQFLARAFAVAETLIAVVVIAEEFAPQHRGWGIGALGAIQACGAGLASVAFGFVDVLPFGWRALYAFGLVPLLLVAYWRRTLPETDRFEALQRQRAAVPAATPALEPVRQLFREHRRLFLALALACLAFGMAMGPAAFFAPKFLQDVHGWSPAAVASLSFFGGGFAIVGNPLSGWLSDRYGRRPMASIFGLGFACVVIAFYTAAGLFAPALWILLIFSMMGTEVTLAAFGAELFPTSQRSTASGVRVVMLALGTVIGLAGVSLLFGWLGSNWTAVAVLGGVSLLVPVLVWLLLPETARRTLEEISESAPESRPKTEAAPDATPPGVPERSSA
jgi:MFS family permease